MIENWKAFYKTWWTECLFATLCKWDMELKFRTPVIQTNLNGGFRWEALQAEMRIDMHRIWKRNLGRDDRCMADVGKEVCDSFQCRNSCN